MNVIKGKLRTINLRGAAHTVENIRKDMQSKAEQVLTMLQGLEGMSDKPSPTRLSSSFAHETAKRNLARTMQREEAQLSPATSLRDEVNS